MDHFYDSIYRETGLTDSGAMIVIVDKIASRASTNEMLITLAIPMEKAALITLLLPKLQKHVAVAFADLDKAAALTFDSPAAGGRSLGSAGASGDARAGRRSSNHEHGQFAQRLFKNGFFRAPRILEALGLEADTAPEEVAKQMALSLGHESMGDVSPRELLVWAQENEVAWLIPPQLRAG